MVNVPHKQYSFFARSIANDPGYSPFLVYEQVERIRQMYGNIPDDISVAGTSLQRFTRRLTAETLTFFFFLICTLYSVFYCYSRKESCMYTFAQ